MILVLLFKPLFFYTSVVIGKPIIDIVVVVDRAQVLWQKFGGKIREYVIEIYFPSPHDDIGFTFWLLLEVRVRLLSSSISIYSIRQLFFYHLAFYPLFDGDNFGEC